MYMLRLISAVLHEKVGPAVSEAALDLRRGELAIVVPLVAILLVLSAWPNAISGHSFGVAHASAALAELARRRPGGANELLARRRSTGSAGTGRRVQGAEDAYTTRTRTPRRGRSSFRARAAAGSGSSSTPNRQPARSTSSTAGANR